MNRVKRKLSKTFNVSGKQNSKANRAQQYHIRSVKQKSSAFGVAACAAEEAALLVDQQVATVGALAGYVPDRR